MNVFFFICGTQSKLLVCWGEWAFIFHMAIGDEDNAKVQMQKLFKGTLFHENEFLQCSFF